MYCFETILNCESFYRGKTAAESNFMTLLQHRVILSFLSNLQRDWDKNLLCISLNSKKIFVIFEVYFRDEKRINKTSK